MKETRKETSSTLNETCENAESDASENTSEDFDIENNIRQLEELNTVEHHENFCEYKASTGDCNKSEKVDNCIAFVTASNDDITSMVKDNRGKDLFNALVFSADQHSDWQRSNLTGVTFLKHKLNIPQLVRLSLKHKSHECLSILLQMDGGDANGVWDEDTGNTFLHYSVGNENQVHCSHVLLQNGAKYDIPNKLGTTPFELAIIISSESCIKLMIEFGADIAKTYDVNTLSKRIRVPSLPKDVQYDMYGFRMDNEVSDKLKEYFVYQSKKDAKRIGKWKKMLKKAKVNKSGIKFHKKFKKRVRKGIPNALRKEAWKAMVPIDKLKKENPDYYQKCLQSDEVDRNVCKAIDLDIPRTFYTHRDYSIRYCPKQIQMFNVLKSFSVHQPKIGYCQGMNFLVALMLLYLDEEDAFWMLTHIMADPKYKMAGLFSPKFPQLHEAFYVHEKVMSRYLPKLTSHFQQQNILTCMYGTKWYLLYLTDLPFPASIRIWDIFLNEGRKVIFSSVKALLQLLEPELIQVRFEKALPILQHIENANIDIQNFINLTLHKKVKAKFINQQISDYQSTQIDSSPDSESGNDDSQK